MSMALGPGATGDKLAAKQDVGADVIVEINGDLRTIFGNTDAYGSLFQGVLDTMARALIGPTPGTDMIVDNIKVSNPGAFTRLVLFYKTKDSNTFDLTTQWATLTLLPGECAEWNSAGWTIYTAQGVAKSAPVAGGLSIYNSSIVAQSGFAANTYLAGSALVLPTGLIRAGTRLRWVFDAVKTGGESPHQT